jgi:hypothetical protein
MQWKAIATTSLWRVIERWATPRKSIRDAFGLLVALGTLDRDSRIMCCVRCLSLCSAKVSVVGR